jgi:glycosyltransferase involved in cell wall biosynthesis
MKIDICICTHNPRPEIFALVLTAIANQTIDKNCCQVLIIDNGSIPAITDQDLAPLIAVDLKHQCIYEPKLGIMYARRRAIEAASSDLIVFVDDDNELQSNYLANALEIAQNNPTIGCFGGKLLLASDLICPDWIKPVLPYLAIKDLGDTEITKCVKIHEWGIWEPPTAGMVVRREIANLYLKRLAELPDTLQLGRKGNQGLLSSEDSLLARGSYELGLSCSYQPKLKLTHHLNSQRFELIYMIKLGYSYGRSNILLDRALAIPVQPMSLSDLIGFILPRVRHRQKEAQSIQHFLCTFAWDLGYIYERQQIWP